MGFLGVGARVDWKTFFLRSVSKQFINNHILSGYSALLVIRCYNIVYAFTHVRNNGSVGAIGSGAEFYHVGMVT